MPSLLPAASNYVTCHSHGCIQTFTCADRPVTPLPCSMCSCTPSVRHARRIYHTTQTGLSTYTPDPGCKTFCQPTKHVQAQVKVAQVRVHGLAAPNPNMRQGGFSTDPTDQSVSQRALPPSVGQGHTRKGLHVTTASQELLGSCFQALDPALRGGGVHTHAPHVLQVVLLHSVRLGGGGVTQHRHLQRGRGREPQCRRAVRKHEVAGLFSLQLRATMGRRKGNTGGVVTGVCHASSHMKGPAAPRAARRTS